MVNIPQYNGISVVCGISILKYNLDHPPCAGIKKRTGNNNGYVMDSSGIVFIVHGQSPESQGLATGYYEGLYLRTPRCHQTWLERQPFPLEL